MSKTASNIVERAMTLIDEQLTDINDAASTEMSLQDMALEILPTVCRDLVKELPYELKRYLAVSAVLVANQESDGESQQSYVKQKVPFVAPSDFWELAAIRLTQWARTVTDYILIDNPEYDIQNNPFTRSGVQNPTVAISNVTSGIGARIECFSAVGLPITVDVFEYISFDNVPDDAGTTWPDELFDEITKALASELNLIKSRIEEAAIKGEETSKAIGQHE